MSLEVTIKEICENLNSNKASERKRSAETLKDYLTRNAVPNLLSDNTRKKVGFSWNDLFDIITEYLLKEAEKSESSKTFHNITYPLCTSILHLCLAGSNTGRAYIKCDKIMEATLFVLRNKWLTNVIGDAYLSLLYKYVLPIEHYVSHITPSIWEDLLDICVTGCLSNVSVLDDFIKLKLLWLVIKNARENCQFSFSLRNSLSDITEYFHKVNRNKKILEVIIDITMQILDMLYLECRLSVCEFIEKNLPLIFEFYEQNLDAKKKSQLFKLICMSITIHHPLGRIQNEESALAHDWNIWRKCFQGIIDLVCIETSYTQKTHRQTNNTISTCPHFYHVSAFTYYLTFQMLAAGVEPISHVKRPIKKQRVTMNKSKNFHDLLQEFQQNHIPWIGVIQMYVKHFGDSICIHDYENLVQILEEFVNTNNVNEIWPVFECLANLTLTSVVTLEEGSSNYCKDLISSLWNSCVRNSTSTTVAQKAIHRTLQTILSLNFLLYDDIKPLLVFYFEKGMPVNDSTVQTLTMLFKKFYSKCCYNFGRTKCFNWFIDGRITHVNVAIVKELFLTLLLNENFIQDSKVSENVENDDLYNVLFKSVDKSILYSDFEFEIPKHEPSYGVVTQGLEINDEINPLILEYLQERLLEYIVDPKSKDFELMECLKILRIILSYIDISFKYNFPAVKSTQLYRTFRSVLKNMYTASQHRLRSDEQIREKNMLLQCLQSILLEEYDIRLNNELRCADSEFFHSMNAILNGDIATDDDENDTDMSYNMLKHNCIFFIAAYCKKKDNYRDELLELILNPKLFNFSFQLDIESALKCIGLLNQSDIDDAPIELTFALMQSMCKDLFRNAKATAGILRTLLKIIDKVWLHSDNLRRNCLIMIKSYLHRCENMYYPPDVAAIAYRCVAKITVLNYKGTNPIELTFKDVLIDKIKGNIYTLRLYCSYLMKEISEAFCEEDLLSCLLNLKDLFTVAVTNDRPTILKDELNNRTATLFHTYYVLALNNPSRIHRIVLEIMILQIERSLDKDFVKKILNVIIKKVTQTSCDIYLDKYILLILQCWSEKKYSFVDLPLYLFGYGSADLISKKYMKWMLSADILWRQHGNFQTSAVLQKFNENMTEENILEECFANITILCLPYVVVDKFGLNINKVLNCKESIDVASRIIHKMRETLESEKWTKLFVENIDQLVLLTAVHLRDYTDAKNIFGVDVPHNVDSYSYPKEVFCGIFKYFGELIDGNLMEYFCENQPLGMLDIIFALWDKVLSEKIFHFMVISLHTFLTFIENIPMGFPSDAIIFNFACVSMINVLKKNKKKEELDVFCKALLIILKRFCAHKEKVLCKETLAEILSILMLRKDYSTECGVVLNYVVTNFKSFDKDLEALHNVMTEVGTEACFTEIKFIEKLRKYESNLLYASGTMLSSMRKFLCAHKKFLCTTINNLGDKGFSEDCEKSVIHKVTVALCNILRDSTDFKMVLEASNCLAEVGTYDLKTLVTVAPKDTSLFFNMKPKDHFKMTVLTTLMDIIFDENPIVSHKVTKALHNIMTFSDGESPGILPISHVSALGVIQKQMLKCLTSQTCESIAKFKVRSELSSWIPTCNEYHFQWITRITIDLLDIIASPSNYLCSLRSICNLKPSICPIILPSLMGLILEHANEETIQMIGKHVNQVFNYIWNISYNDDAIKSDGSTVSKVSNILSANQKMIVHYSLDLVNAIRLQRAHIRVRKYRTHDILKFMKLDYEKLAWAATLADKNLAAIYYAELWAAAANDGVPPSSPEATANLDNGERIQRILRNCFVSIGELEAIDGCGTAHLSSEEERRRHLLHTGQYADSLLLHDILLSNGNQTDSRLQHGVVTSLHKSGMHHLALQYIKSFPENEELNDVKYDCLAYLGDWSEIVDTKELDTTANRTFWNPDIVIKSFRYACLKESLNSDPNPCLETRLSLSLSRAQLATSKLCLILNMENCQSVYKVVANLHLLRDIRDYCSVRCERTNLTELLGSWQVEKLPSFKDFRHLETMLSQRSLILEHAAKHYAHLSTQVIDLQLRYVEMGLSNQRVQMSQRLLESVKKMQATEKVALVESQIAWAKGQKDIAVASLHSVMSDRSSDVILTAMCYRQYGLWMAECKRENARDIINKYLEKSLEFLNKRDHAETRFKVYHDIARFADSEYKQIVSYMNSTVFENKVKCIRNMKGTAASLKVSQTSLTKDERKALLTNDRFMQLDEAEVSNTRAEKESFLNLALRYYMLSLRHCEINNLSIFRVISLWFDNPDFEFEDGSNSTIQELLQSIPSWKFISVLPQLAPRLTTEICDFAKYLKEILATCAIEHPHHTLPILFNLKNSDKDNSILNASKGESCNSDASIPEPRVSAASALVRELSQRQDLAPIIAQMEILCDAFISFAYFKPKSNAQSQQIPEAEPLCKLRKLDAIPIPTVTLPIKKNGDYSSLPSISSFNAIFKLVGGINYPKKVVCRTSDGVVHYLLIKGEDDLRQDAVMQQVFNIVNTLLGNDPVTKKNKLLIRTYKVAPMSRRSGVLEWCGGTTPLGVYLQDAHTRYRPKDITPNAARTKLKSCQDSRKSNQEKLRIFMEILAEFKPVFHNFFTEHYHDPITWYERRLAYTRSVATSSMVGYILGIGDRHVHNILIDKNTGEVIHIDFGIAFDQGKALPTPETIPFRLTQDIISGFGCSGIEGIFRRCCENTFQLLRDNQETLLTILEVLLYDPLYSWTVKGTIKKSSVHSSRDSSPARSGLAERALLAVGDKLSGTGGGAPGAVAVAGQVARLLHAATDPANLSKLFHGWQPYL